MAEIHAWSQGSALNAAISMVNLGMGFLFKQEEKTKPLELEKPFFVSDMSFGALSREAKIALSKGAEMSGTGICSGEGGMLPT